MRLERPRENQGRAHLPMTSLIDVVFLLLIYFLVTASLTAREADLASALQADQEGSGRAADLQPQVLIVDLSDSGNVVYRIGERAMTSRDQLLDVLAQLSKEAGVFVKVSNVAPVGAAATALQTCKDAGFTKVTYVPSS